MRRLSVVVALGAIVLTATAAQAATTFFQGFETDTSGWFQDSPTGGSIVREPSGYTNGGGYASGISSATGGFHARLQLDPTDLSCIPGSADCSGPFTRWGGYESVFPVGGYKTSVDIYLDTTFAATHLDYRFDWDSAINDSSGNFLQDYVFNAGTNVAGFVIGTSTNAGRGSTFPANPCPSPSTTPNGCRTPVQISTSGWYTFQHTFTDVGGSLAVNFKILDSSGSPVSGADWTIFTGNAIAGVGGHRYGWFANQEIQDLAIDNTALAGLTLPGSTCLVADSGTTRTLLADCTTTQTLFIPNGFTFDGASHTITAIDPSGGHFLGAILQNAGTTANVQNLRLTTSNLTDACDAGANRLRGILFDGASGVITNNTVTELEQGAGGLSGCQEGNGIDVRNSAGTAQPSVTISTNTVTDYQKTGILATGSVAATMTSNIVTGDGGIAYIAQNGIQISDSATAKLVNNDVSLNNYTPAKVTACGLLIYKAGGVSGATKTGVSYIKADNKFHDNETDICNFGKGGGFSPAS